MLRIAKQRIEVFERKLDKTEMKNLTAIAQNLRLIVSSKKENLEHFEQLNDFMPKDEGIIVVSIDLSALNAWVLQKMEALTSK